MGDVVLIKVAQIINKHIRQTDSFGRWGGDEFLIVLPQTNKEQTKSIIFGLERNLNTIEFEFDKSLKILENAEAKVLLNVLPTFNRLNKEKTYFLFSKAFFKSKKTTGTTL